MKTKLLPLLFVAALHGQEPAGEPAELLDPIVKEPLVQTEPAPEPQRLEVPPEDIISTKVIIRDGQKFTIQKVQPQELEPLPESAPPRVLTPEEEAARDAARAARLAARGAYRNLMFSCTVYDGEKRWSAGVAKVGNPWNTSQHGATLISITSIASVVSRKTTLPIP